MAESGSAKRSQHALDWLNFFIADVETAFGPFVAVWLSSQGWSQGAIGTMISVNSGIALATQTPAGWLLDRVPHKRAILGVSLACIAAGSLLIALFPRTWLVVLGEVLHGITGGTVRLAIAAIGLGLVGHRAYSHRVGRNNRFDALGNASTAAGMGVTAHFLSPGAPFLLSAGLCVPAFVALLCISGKEVDPVRARHGKADAAPGRWHDLLRNRGLMVFAAVLFLFQFADASLLPLAGGQLAAERANRSDLVVAALVVVPQLVTALIATFVARKSDEWGRRIMLAAALGAEALRAGLFALAVSPWLLVASSVLGGLTAAMIGILTPLVVADCTKGSGRYNFGLGAVGTLSGIGATLSTVTLGFVAQRFGFAAGFSAIAAASLVGIALVYVLMPETAEASRTD